MRHEAADIAWHTRHLSRHVGTQQCPCGAPVTVGEGLQVLVYAADQSDLFARICGYFDRRVFILDAASRPQRLCARHLQVVSDILQALPRTHPHGGERSGPSHRCRGPCPSRGASVSRRVDFSHHPRVTLRPDEKPALAARISPATALACSTRARAGTPPAEAMQRVQDQPGRARGRHLSGRARAAEQFYPGPLGSSAIK